MGIDIRALRESKAYKTPQGTVRRYTFWQRLEREMDREAKQQEAVERFIDRFGHQENCLVTPGYDCTNHRPLVYRQEVGKPLIYDCDKFPGTYVGALEKVGGRWIINTEVGETEDEDRAAARWTRLNDVTQQQTAFESFFALCTTPGYRPSIRISGGPDAQTDADLLFLADGYDAKMIELGDDRRAYRYGG